MLHRYFNSTGEIYTTSFAIKTVGETDTFGDLLDAMIQEPYLCSHGNTGIWFWNCMTATSCLVLWSYSRRSNADQPRIKCRRCHTIWIHVVGLEHNPKKSPRSANVLNEISVTKQNWIPICDETFIESNVCRNSVDYNSAPQKANYITYDTWKLSCAITYDWHTFTYIPHSTVTHPR